MIFGLEKIILKRFTFRSKSWVKTNSIPSSLSRFSTSLSLKCLSSVERLVRLKLSALTPAQMLRSSTTSSGQGKVTIAFFFFLFIGKKSRVAMRTKQKPLIGWLGSKNTSGCKSNTTLQSTMNAKLSQHRFGHCHENGLIKTIQTIPHNL